MKALLPLALFLGAATAVSAAETKQVLTLDTASKMAAACLKHQAQTKYKPINVVIVDDGGNVILTNRQDGACKACGSIAESKARTAALFDDATRSFEVKAYGKNKDGEGAELPGIALVPGLIAFPGGVPIHAGGTVIGGVGVSGASGDEDEQCAIAAIQAFEVEQN
ncbi:GlcG/HbpS family heme-binding protein (plasmid) [Agrobacterium deltaense]|uniref:GlcG/HbpS family heme-binding protein n=1 Tax=Agrobacterium deltaense TaxID=1183412 RepID=UPI003D97E0BF